MRKDEPLLSGLLEKKEYLNSLKGSRIKNLQMNQLENQLLGVFLISFCRRVKYILGWDTSLILLHKYPLTKGSGFLK